MPADIHVARFKLTQKSRTVWENSVKGNNYRYKNTA